MKRVVFDLDDTISVHRNRDYANALPVEPVVRQMRRLRAEMPEVQIVILTARGMASCNGDAKLAEERNRPVLEDWLNRHGVPYDEIIFGKPLGDAYVDDKAVSAFEFGSMGASRLSGGFSGNSVTRVGRIVVKRCDNAQEVADWYEEAHGYGEFCVKFPRYISHQLGKVYLEYADGMPVSEMDAQTIDDLGILQRVQFAVQSFGRIVKGENSVGAYCDYLNRRCDALGWDAAQWVTPVATVVHHLRKRTFHHGDFSTMNLIYRDRETLTAIDPNPKGDVQCGLIDAAKFYASLKGLECVLADKRLDVRKAALADKFLALFDYDEQICIPVLAKTLVLRVAYNAKRRERMDVVDRLKEVSWT